MDEKLQYNNLDTNAYARWVILKNLVYKSLLTVRVSPLFVHQDQPKTIENLQHENEDLQRLAKTVSSDELLPHQAPSSTFISEQEKIYLGKFTYKTSPLDLSDYDFMEMNLQDHLPAGSFSIEDSTCKLEALYNNSISR